MRRTTRIATSAATVVALAAPSAALAQQDLRSPDAQDVVASDVRPTDLRSPDAQDAVASDVRATDLRSPDVKDAVAADVQSIDLRSPDARDVPSQRTIVTPAPATQPAGDGLEWADAGIGAAGMLGLILAGAGGAVLVRRHHRGAAALPH
jgi:hypothetical protein